MKRARRQDEEAEYIPTPEEEAEIEAGIAEIERGEYITAEELMRELKDFIKELETHKR